MAVRIMVGDARAALETLPAASAQCVVTSPPYFGLRDYGAAGQIGLEQTPDAYVAALVDVFRAVRRVLRDDGTVWLNLGDTYAMTTRGGGCRGKQHTNAGSILTDRSSPIPAGAKAKDLLMIPARVALALQADGWYLRSNIVWHKPNPMPESVKDRPTNAHESVFLLTKSARYFYDADAVKEPSACGIDRQRMRPNGLATDREKMGQYGFTSCGIAATRNLRNVWTITPRPYKGAHFATFPAELAARCIRAGSRPGDTVLDPFFGAGTTALAAPDRHCIGVDISPAYVELARARLSAAGLTVQVDGVPDELVQAAE